MNVWLLTFLEDKDMQSLHLTFDGAREYVEDVLKDMCEAGEGEWEFTLTEDREDYKAISTPLGDFVAELKPVGK